MAININNAQDLYDFMTTPSLSGDYVLTTNIDMGDLICPSIIDFQGTFNGQNYIITINQVVEGYLGFFGSLSGNVENVNIIFNIEKTNNGGFASSIAAGSATNCNILYNKSLTIGKIGDINTDIGGFVGNAQGATFTQCTAIFTQDVIFESADGRYAGGFSGYLSDSTVNACVVFYQKNTRFNSGDYSGGFISFIDENPRLPNTFTNCFAIYNNYYFNGNFANNDFTYAIGSVINSISTLEIAPYSFFASGQLNNFSWISQLVNILIQNRKEWVIPFNLNSAYTVNTDYSLSMKNWVINSTLINNGISGVSSTYNVITQNLNFGYSQLDGNTPVVFVNPNVNLEKGTYYIKENVAVLTVNGEQVYYQSGSNNTIYLNNMAFSVGQTYKTDKYSITNNGTGSTVITVDTPGTPWWVWLIIGITALIVVIIIVMIARRYVPKSKMSMNSFKF